ncbi:MAG: transketolase [Azospirillum sp.]|nr:transketolase [Azospirillum sp.]
MTVTTPDVAAARHGDMAGAIRLLAADAVEQAKSGHPGMPMGMADVATVLFTRHLKFDAAAPRWADRDRFVLSAGHGSMLLYAVSYLAGYADVTLDQLRAFRQLGSRTPGHPEVGHPSSAETTTGPLGQGLANAVGMALAERLLQARFGADLVDHHTFAMCGDGCLMEGISQEAISLAGHLRLAKLIVLWDDNRITIDGALSLSSSDDQLARFAASGWRTLTVDGHDPAAIDAALTAAKAGDRPTLIACRTTIGYGAPTKAGTEKCHGAPLGAAELAGLRDRLGCNWPPFEVPAPVLGAWRTAGARGRAAHGAWAGRVEALEPARRTEFERCQAGALPQEFERVVAALKQSLVAAAPKIATRKASQDVLEVLTAAVPDLVGGSADLTHSNLTQTKATKPIAAEDFSGRYVFYGIREFAMAAAMNGMALHGGVIPYGGTFLVFADYMRNAIRLSALMGIRVIYVLSHDSIGLGEDGPTHQPVEHLAMLRATPNLTVFRPADAVETAECWALALAEAGGPSVLALSRQAVPAVRTVDRTDNLCALGGYVLAEAEGPRKVTVIATGTEVSLALKARSALQAEGIGCAVVSLPSWELFDRQPASYRAEVLGPGSVRVAVEALSTFGWERYVGTEGAIIGMTGFGASAPAEALYAHFGITAEAVVAAAKARL